MSILSTRRSLISPGNAGRTNLFGVNMSGAEFAPTFSNYHLPIASDWAYLASKGVKFVRFPIAWESIQTTLGGSLASTYLASVISAITTARAHGIGVMVDLHNYGAYVNSAHWGTGSPAYYSPGNGGTAGTGVYIFGDGQYTAAQYTTYFNDVWTKLATALVGTPGLVGYGLMNEPGSIYDENLLGMQSPYLSDVRNNFTGLAPLLTPYAEVSPLGYKNAWHMSTTAGAYDALDFGLTLLNVPYSASIYARSLSGTVPLMINVDYAGGTDHTCTTSWQRFSYTFTPTAAAHDIVFQIDQTAAVTMALYGAKVELGSSATTYQPSAWYLYAQGAISAVRAVDDSTPIYINGVPSSGSLWTLYNYELAGLTGRNLIFEAHNYFDFSGTYTALYSSHSFSDSSAGVTQVSPFVNWCKTTGVKGYIGEFAIPSQTQCSLGTISGSLFTAGGTLGAYAFDIGQQLSGPGITSGPNSVIVSAGTGAGGAGTYNLAGSPGNVSSVAVQATITPSSPWWAMGKKFLEYLRNNSVPATPWFYGANGCFIGFSYNPISGVGDNPSLIQILNIGKDSGFNPGAWH